MTRYLYTFAAGAGAAMMFAGWAGLPSWASYSLAFLLCVLAMLGLLSNALERLQRPPQPQVMANTSSPSICRAYSRPRRQ